MEEINSKLEEKTPVVAALARETRELIVELSKRLKDKGLIDSASEKHIPEVDIIVHQYESLLNTLLDLEKRPYKRECSDIFDFNSGLMSQLFEIFKSHGLTLREHENFDDEVLQIARKFGNVNMNLRDIQDELNGNPKLEHQRAPGKQENFKKSTDEREIIESDEVTKLRLALRLAIAFAALSIGLSAAVVITGNRELKKKDEIIYKLKEESLKRERVETDLRRRLNDLMFENRLHDGMKKDTSVLDKHGKILPGD